MASITLVDHIIIGDNAAARELASYLKISRRGYLILKPQDKAEVKEPQISIIEASPMLISNTGIPKDTFKITDHQGRIYRSRSIIFTDLALFREAIFHPGCTPRRDWDTFRMLLTQEMESINVEGIFFSGNADESGRTNSLRFLYRVLESRFHDGEAIGGLPEAV